MGVEMVKIWKSKESVVKHDAAADVTILTNAALDTFFSGGTVITSVLKNITIVEPESDLNSLNLMGLDGNGYANQEFDEQPYTQGSISGTMVLTDGSNLEQYAYGAGTAVSGTHTRFFPGKVGNRKALAMLVNLTIATTGVGAGSSKEVNFAIDNAFITKLGDTRLSDVAGQWERDFTAMCLPKDFHGPEFLE